MKTNYILKTFLLFLFLFTVNLLTSQNKYLSFHDGAGNFIDQSTVPKRDVINFVSDGSEITFNFEGAVVSELEAKGEVYQLLNIEGLIQTGDIGAPALPVRNEIIALPRGCDAKIMLLEVECNEFQNYNIHPVLEPAKDTEGSPEPEFKKDEAVYSKDAFFPENIIEIVSVAFSRSTPLNKIQIRPVQYNPVSKTLRVYTKISFRIEFVGGESSFDYIAQENTIHYTNLLKLNVINSENIPDGLSISEYSGKTDRNDYIIITHSQYESQANDLAIWKRQQGYSVEVVSQSNWTAAQVKNAIEERYNNWTPKPDYFLIIGDHNGNYAVPGEIHTVPGGSETFATDLYFACMDGTNDWHPDLSHGRISVSVPDEATTIVNKIIAYEQTPVNYNDFYENILNCAQYQDDDGNAYADRRFCHTSEEIRDYLQNEHSYFSERIYYTSTTADVTNLKYNNGYYSSGQLLPDELRNNSFNWNGGVNEIISAIDIGKFMVFHRDHGYAGGSGWAHPNFTTSNINSLNNGDRLPVIFSINCHTGEYQLSNCFAEKFLRENNKGAVGVIGAAYYSYSGYNDALSVGMIDAIWADPGIYPVLGNSGTGSNYTIGTENAIYSMGDIMNQGLYAMEQNFNGYSEYEKYQYELFHYFGDPTMKIWTSNPYNNIISANHSNEIICSENIYNITSSTPNSVATLLYNNELIGTAALDSNGDGTILYSIDEAGETVVLTITKHNCLPYSTELEIIGNCGFIPMMNTLDANYITDNSAELTGEIIHDGNESIFESGFVYSTDPDPIIGLSGVTKVETYPLISFGIYNINIEELQNNTIYYFKAYSVNNIGVAYGEQNYFDTQCEPVSIYPWVYDFEFAEDIQECWTQEYFTGDNIDWHIDTNGSYSGNSYIYYFDSDFEEDNTLLISPILDLSLLNSAELKYWYLIQESFVGQDELKTLFRSGPYNDWIELNHINEFNEDWNEVSLILPELSSQSQIAFDGYALHGNGIRIDLLSIDNESGLTDKTNNSIQIFPNPSNGIFYIKNFNNEETSELNIFTSKGQKIYYDILNSEVKKIDLSNLSSGVYHIQIISSYNVFYENLIIRK